MSYAYEEAFKLSLEYFNGNELATKVFVDKYALRDENGLIVESTPRDMHCRLASEFAKIDEKYGLDFNTQYHKYLDAMHKFSRIVPQGSPMAAIGNPYQVLSASNCVVIESPEDCIGGIFRAGMNLAQLYKRRCVEENSYVITREIGAIRIRDVAVGMHVLSYDVIKNKSIYKKVLNKFDTEVNAEDRVIIKFSHNIILKTSKKHPILVYKYNEWVYCKVSELLVGDMGLSSSNSVAILGIEPDTESNKYIDIEVEDTGNFYCGNSGFVVIHNCGSGIDISTLRPEGALVNNAARSTSGAWSFADFYSYITRMIAMSGRRGALMITLDVHHPDVLKFVTMKHDLTKVTGANISVRLSDEFMRAVKDNTEYEQRWPCEGQPKVRFNVKAREIWDVIVESATKTAEPGLIFWDTATRNLPAHCYPEFKSVTTNPCSEIILSKFDSCRLISINLTGYVRKAFEDNAEFDFEAFSKDVRLATRMADNLVDIELKLIERIREKACTDELICDVSQFKKALIDAGISQEMVDASAKKIADFSETGMWDKFWEAGHNGRRTGLGTHGLADTLTQLNIKYDSADGLAICQNIYDCLRNCAYEASIDLARERGAFPAFDYNIEKDCEFIKRLPVAINEKIAKYGRRNISLLTQAPTGSVSILSRVGESDLYNVSSGIEPVFRNKYTRRKKINEGDQNVKVDFVDANGDKWQHFEVYHSNVQYYIQKTHNKELPEYFVTSDQINWHRRIDLQSVIQLNIDHSISNTINCPKGTDSEVISSLYMDAWESGLKGITVYVDGSRDGVLVTNINEKDNKITALEAKIAELEGQHIPNVAKSPKRPYLLTSETHKLKIDFGDEEPRNAYITVSFFPNTRRPYEILIIAPYSGLNEKDLQILELVARTTSMNLRHGMPIKFICEQLDKIGGQYIFSIPTNVARILRHYITDDDMSIPPPAMSALEFTDDKGLLKCRECGKRSYRMTGQACGFCENCGYSGCG